MELILGRHPYHSGSQSISELAFKLAGKPASPQQAATQTPLSACSSAGKATHLEFKSQRLQADQWRCWLGQQTNHSTERRQGRGLRESPQPPSPQGPLPGAGTIAPAQLHCPNSHPVHPQNRMLVRAWALI